MIQRSYESILIIQAVEPLNTLIDSEYSRTVQPALENAKDCIRRLKGEFVSDKTMTGYLSVNPELLQNAFKGSTCLDLIRFCNSVNDFCISILEVGSPIDCNALIEFVKMAAQNIRSLLRDTSEILFDLSKYFENIQRDLNKAMAEKKSANAIKIIKQLFPAQLVASVSPKMFAK